MASANVDYYQKQKDLLDSMHSNENHRRKLEAQLQAYFQSDQKLAKLRAVKLQSYWKKICEDEKRSKQRNSQLLRDLDRIEANMAGLEARREKIKHMKDQYFKYIEQTYPEWLKLVNQKKEEQQKFEQIKQQQAYEQQQQQQQQTFQQQKEAAYQQQLQQQAFEYRQHLQEQENHQQQQAYLLQQQQQSFQNQQQRQKTKVAQEEKPQKQFGNENTIKKEQEYLYEKQQLKQSMTPAEEEEEEDENDDEKDVFDYHIPPPLPCQPPPTLTSSNVNKFQDREYTNLKDVRRQPEVSAPSQVVTVHVPSVDREEAGSPAKLRPDSAQRESSNQNWVPADRDTSVQSWSISDVDGEPPFSQPVQSVTVRQKSEPPAMVPLSDDDFSEFGEDLDLPSGDGVTGPVIKQDVQPGTVLEHGNAQRVQALPQKHEPHLEEYDGYDDDIDQRPVMVHPELAPLGLFHLLRYVEEELANALSVEGYYRTRNPAPSTRKDIIHKANSHMSFANSDGESVSMVVLEQLTPVVRRLPGACLMSDTILVRKTDVVNESLIRDNIHRDAVEIWDKLLEHFLCLVKNRVMGTRELATVFVPCLVHKSSQHQDKAVSILETIVESAFERKEGMVTPLPQQDSTTIDTARSSQQDGVPPLKFGSLVDSKAYTDEESSMITQSMNTEGAKLPLNETEAYKNLLSGSMPASRPQVQADDTDENSDNELEKQYLSTFTPRSHASKHASEQPIDMPSSEPPLQEDSPDQSADQEPFSEIGYVPTGAKESTIKSVLGSTGGSSQQRRLADKLGMNSDLDTDTEVDIENMVTKKDDDDDDDFYDFYG